MASDDVIQAEPLTLVATPAKGSVSALLMRPEQARWLLVFGHGAGAGMRHRFMEAISARLAALGIATLRYQFPYMEAGSRRPDARAALLATVRAAVAAARFAAPDLPLLAGGKSMGGRMTSLAAAEAALPGVRGIVFVGFPLHPAGRPSTERADHLERVDLPLLFLQGERDQLGGLDLLRPLCARLGTRATLHVIPTADHGFHVLKSSGRTDGDVLYELARTVAAWAATLGQDRRDVEGGNRIDAQDRAAVGHVESRRCQRPHVGAVRLIEQDRQIPEDRARVGDLGDAHARADHLDRPLDHHEKLAGDGAASQHEVAGLVNLDR